MVTFGTGGYFCQAVRVIHALTGEKLFTGSVGDPERETMGRIDMPAILSVPSTLPDRHHAVYWCDGKTYDPKGYIRRGWPEVVDSIIAPGEVFIDGEQDWQAWVDGFTPDNLLMNAKGAASAAGCLPWRNP